MRILLVEDSKSDAHLAIDTLKGCQICDQIDWVKNGVEALDFLYKRGKYTNAPRPDLILLDLNLPKKTGQEVLQDIKQDEALQIIPVVILSTSANDEDILRSYQSRVNCYLVKPISLDEFVAVVKSIEQFWLQTVRFPPQPDNHD
jgi:chemotaxis family two-component system response regulator Rcp1